MLHLVDYEGSGSEEDDHDGEAAASFDANHKKDEFNETYISPIEQDYFFYEHQFEPQKLTPKTVGFLNSLEQIPTASESSLPTGKLKNDDVLEDFLQLKKDWEKDIEIEHNANKPDRNNKKKVPLFGEFGSIKKQLTNSKKAIDNDSDEDEVPVNVKNIDLPCSSKSGLLSLLPKPRVLSSKKHPTITTSFPTKSQENTVKFKNLLANKNSNQQDPTLTKPTLPLKRPHEEVQENHDESDDDESDILGLSLKMPKVTVPTDPSHYPTSTNLGTTTTTVFYEQESDIVGPVRPEKQCVPIENEGQQAKLQRISNEMATKLIYERDLAGFGISEMAATRIANDITDVSVDNVLGPNIRETLLRNLNTKVMAQVATGPLPKVRKDPKDRLAKQKHQITHLAALAVSREEELQDKWAENRSKKKASSQKYGF